MPKFKSMVIKAGDWSKQSQKILSNIDILGLYDIVPCMVCETEE